MAKFDQYWSHFSFQVGGQVVIDFDPDFSIQSSLFNT